MIINIKDLSLNGNPSVEKCWKRNDRIAHFSQVPPIKSDKRRPLPAPFAFDSSETDRPGFPMYLIQKECINQGITVKLSRTISKGTKSGGKFRL